MGENTLMRTRLFLFALTLILVLMACSRPIVETVEVAVAQDNPIMVAAPAVPTTASPPSSSSPTKTTVVTSSTTTLPPLPVPDPLPENPFAVTERIILGTIEIPAIDLEWNLYQGMTLTSINRGPSQWPGTALPGEVGNMVIAGHRTTWGAPFRHLDSLEPGDEIIFRETGAKHVYRVAETLIVLPTDTWIANQDHNKTVTLFACHPVGSARQRIVIKGEFVETIVPTAPDDAA